MPTSGTITTLGTIVAKYQKKGKTVTGRIQIPITTNGTGSGAISFTLPSTMAADTILWAGGIEKNSVNKSIAGKAGSTTTGLLFFYDGTYPGANGYSLNVWFAYEEA